MQETLQDRLQREARETITQNRKCGCKDGDILTCDTCLQNQSIAIFLTNKAISETIKAGVELIEGEKYAEEEIERNPELGYPVKSIDCEREGANKALQTAVTKLQELGKK